MKSGKPIAQTDVSDGFAVERAAGAA